jgi:hypothetical protein
MNILETVRRLVGRRHKITRQEMADILAALATDGLSLYNDCSFSSTPMEWANSCTDITVISVMAHGCTPHGQIRYDQPGSMAPMLHAELIFVSVDLGSYEYDQIGQMRRHADRLLIVSGNLIELPAKPPRISSWIQRLRHDERIDGSLAILHDDGILELRDPNDGQSDDLADKTRYQFRVTESGNVERRVMPPESVGDIWLDTGTPQWEPSITPPENDLIYDWWDAQVQ